jgi:hypothetical protein
MTTPESLLEQIAIDQRTIADLNQRIADNKALLDACLEDGSLEHLLDEDGKAFRYTTITLSRSKRTTWRYPEATTRQIKALQELAQLNGDAEATTVHFWTVRAQ